MSVSYTLFTEAKIEGEWRTLNPKITNINKEYYGNADYVIVPTYASWSRTYFGATFDKLLEIGRYFSTDELSVELLKELGEDYIDADWYARLIINYNEIKACLPKSVINQFHGYVHKDDIFRYESGEDDDIYNCYTYEEYQAFPDEKKKLLQYFEWDAHTDWPYHFKIICERIEVLRQWWFIVNDIDITEDNIRVILFEG